MQTIRPYAMEEGKNKTFQPSHRGHVLTKYTCIIYFSLGKGLRTLAEEHRRIHTQTHTNKHSCINDRANVSERPFPSGRDFHFFFFFFCFPSRSTFLPFQDCTGPLIEISNFFSLLQGNHKSYSPESTLKIG